MTDINGLREASNLAGYAIERLIRQEGEAAFFVVASPDGERLLMKVAPVAGENAERQLAVWERSRHLRHPNIVHLRDPGRTEFGGEGYIYALLEYPDDSLATALENGPLNEEEARAVLEAALSALRYLHSQGMVHGAVTPEHVVAVGNEIKLTTDALSESDDLEGPMEDVRQLGELVRTIRAPEPGGEPLATVVRHAADADARHRWTLAEIARELEKFVPAAAAPVIVEAPVEAAPAVAASQIEEPVGTGDSRVAAESVAGGAALLQQGHDVAASDARETFAQAAQRAVRPAALYAMRRWEDLLRTGRRAWEAFSASDMPKWPFAAAAVLVILILLLNRHHNAPVQRATSYTPAAVARPVSAPPPVSAEPSGPATWRVIAFTYKSRRMAAKKAKEINHRWPELQASVRSPKERHGYFLVTLGRAMDREEATELQRKAHTLGLPRDTYLENDGGE